MLKTELIKKSPIRILDKTIHGGVGNGNLGVFTARKGVGKTASLVHVATDKLLWDQRVMHISFADDPQHIETWYKLVFQEVAKSYKLEDANEVYNETIRNRMILHFKQKDVTFAYIKNNFNNLIKHANFKVDMIIVDGYDFELSSVALLQEWKNLAKEMDVEIWFSATLHRDDLQLDAQGIPAPINKFTDLFSVIIMLNPKEEYIDFGLLKAHDDKEITKLCLKLDPKTLLISNHRV